MRGKHIGIARGRAARTGVMLLLGAAVAFSLPWALPRGAVRVQAAEAPVTYSRQIAPLLYANCTGCHHSGGSAPFSLMSYGEVRRWGTAIESVTESRYMPPWLPEPGHGEFAGNRRLSADEIALIKRWVDAGMPEGERSEAPRVPVYTSGWELGPPDLVLQLTSPMTVPASGTDLFRNFILPFPLKQTKWVRAMEIKPGSPGVVHHANLILDRSASLRRMHPQDWQQGIPGMDVVVDAGERFDPDGHFLDWKPDSTALVEAPGMPWRLDPGDDLVLNMHLKPTGKVESIRAEIGLYFAKEPATKFPILLQLEHDAALDIPAGDPNFVVEDQLTLPEAVDVLAIYPHAHYLGKRLEGWAVLPDGTRTDLILIPNWDIDRQSIYRFAQPVPLPAGSVVHMRYSYDNSAENPHNPNSPPIRVKAGNRSEDEMGHLWLQVLPRESTVNGRDARAPLLRAWMENVLRKSPTDAPALFNLASLDMSAGDYGEAAALYRRALATRPTDARMRTALGAALEETGDAQGAASAYREAIAAESSYADAHFDLATLAFKVGDRATAEEQFRSVLALDPQDPAAHVGLGSVLAAEDQSDAAAAQFQQALRLDAQNADALYDLATIEAGKGQVAAALEHLQAAAALRPESADTHRGLAALYGMEGDVANAIQEQKRVIALGGAQPDVWNDLGVMQARHGESAAAYASFQHALALDPGNAAARANLSRLQSQKN